MTYRYQKLSLIDWMVLVGFASYYILPSISVKVAILEIILIGITYIFN